MNLDFLNHQFYLFLPLIPAFFAVYVYIHRTITAIQSKSIKSIFDEMLKINDFCIDFSCKYQSCDSSLEVDPKVISDIESLKLKINSHLVCLSYVCRGFQFGSVFSYIISITPLLGGFYLKNKFIQMDKLLFAYGDKICMDTVLEENSEIFENKRIIIKSDFELISKKRITDIVSASIDIIDFFEKNSAKILR